MIRAIVATDPTGIVGLNGTIPWRFKADLQHFKRQTMSGVCIMGRKTWESIPSPKSGGPKLPGRSVVVLSRTPDTLVQTGEKARRSLYLPSAIKWAADSQAEFDGSIWICGGGEVYAEAQRLDLIDEVDITEVPRVPFVAIEEIDGSVVTRWDPFELRRNGLMNEDPGPAQPEGFAEAGLVRRVLRRRGEPRGLENARRALEVGR